MNILMVESSDKYSFRTFRLAHHIKVAPGRSFGSPGSLEPNEL